jgi:hypothetical protein
MLILHSELSLQHAACWLYVANVHYNMLHGSKKTTDFGRDALLAQHVSAGRDKLTELILTFFPKIAQNDIVLKSTV